MGYCVSCGHTAQLNNGLCPQCYKDFNVAKKEVKIMKDIELTLQGLEKAAKGYGTMTAFAFLVAIQEAQTNGSLYGWQ